MRIATAPATTAPATTASAGAAPTWLIIALLCIVGALIVGAFTLTMYNLSAPRSTLKNLLGIKRPVSLATFFHGPDEQQAKATREHVEKLLESLADPKQDTGKLVQSLSNAARVNKRTTRTTLAVVGFSLLGVIVIGVFGLEGDGVVDLRTSVVSSVVTLVASIAGFYFGAQGNGGSGVSTGDGPGVSTGSGSSNAEPPAEDAVPPASAGP
jgi:hypothetical protein